MELDESVCRLCRLAVEKIILNRSCQLGFSMLRYRPVNWLKIRGEKKCLIKTRRAETS